MVLAHIGGVPVEELLPTMTATGGVLLLGRSSLADWLRHRRDKRSSV